VDYCYYYPNKSRSCQFACCTALKVENLPALFSGIEAGHLARFDLRRRNHRGVFGNDALAALDEALHAEGMDLCFAEMKGPVKDRLKRYGLFTSLGTENFFPTLGQAVDRYLAVHKIEWRDWDEVNR
jgi:hypothetical protein